jgi:hypothetical protein
MLEAWTGLASGVESGERAAAADGHHRRARGASVPQAALAVPAPKDIAATRCKDWQELQAD